jgi:peptide/nickel transport system permease protein
MIDQARDELSRTPIIWWNITGASMALFTLVLAVNLIADTIRDILDPRTRKEAP